MLAFFKAHPAESIKKKYYDIHCMLGDSVSAADIQAMRKAAMGKVSHAAFIRNENHHFQVKGDHIVPVSGSKIPVGNDVLDVSYADLFLLPMMSSE
jgi:hypothetical protein